MTRVTHFQQAAAGLDGISVDTSGISKAIIKAFMPAIKAEIPGMVQTAVPHIRGMVPGLVSEAMPHLQRQIPSLMPMVLKEIPSLMPALAKQVPVFVDSALPLLQAKLPAVTKTVMPLLRVELERALDQYAKTYLGPAAQFKEWAPALAMVAAGVTLFASGIVIYRFWAGE